MLTHAITSLTLENFRNYESLALRVAQGPVVLRGPNGAGKTNILEAISMLAPGRGLRSARLSEMDRLVASKKSLVASGFHSMHDERIVDKPWIVAAHLTTCGEVTFIGTGRDAVARNEKRIIKINGEKVRSHAELAQYSCIQWLTPSMDQVFIEGSSSRRKFFDRLAYGFAPEHVAQVSAYESAMRERNKLLSDTRKGADPYWLSVLEQQMAENAVAITLVRLETLERLHAELHEDIAGFPRADISLSGILETELAEESASALEAEQKFAERLLANRAADAARGRANQGCHRSEWHVVHREKNCEAAHCSTGEQKALLLSIVLAFARARTKWCGVAPILLLDEVIAHLDKDKRTKLFELIHESRIQAWMTGTDAADFEGLKALATVIEIADGIAK